MRKVKSIIDNLIIDRCMSTELFYMYDIEDDGSDFDTLDDILITIEDQGSMTFIQQDLSSVVNDILYHMTAKDAVRLNANFEYGAFIDICFLVDTELYIAVWGKR